VEEKEKGKRCDAKEEEGEARVRRGNTALKKEREQVAVREGDGVGGFCQ
jgi:hypothetical protein